MYSSPCMHAPKLDKNGAGLRIARLAIARLGSQHCVNLHELACLSSGGQSQNHAQAELLSSPLKLLPRPWKHPETCCDDVSCLPRAC